MPRLTIILPFADDRPHLPAMLADLGALAGDDLEILLVDDASQDGSTELAATWVRDHPRARLLHHPARRGVARARETGIDHARGEYVWMVDSDDRLPPDTARLLRELPDLRGADVHVFAALHGGRRTGPRVPGTLDRRGLARALLSGGITGHLWNKIIRTRLLSTHRPEVALSSQSDFLQLLTLVPAVDSVRLHPEVLYAHHPRAGSITSTDAAQTVNTAYCTDRALAVLPALAGAGEQECRSFRLWFHLVPCAVTPVALGWPAPVVALIQAGVVPRMTAATIMAAAREGHVRVAAHAALLRLCVPLRCYPLVYPAVAALS